MRAGLSQVCAVQLRFAPSPWDDRSRAWSPRRCLRAAARSLDWAGQGLRWGVCLTLHIGLLRILAPNRLPSVIPSNVARDRLPECLSLSLALAVARTPPCNIIAALAPMHIESVFPRKSVCQPVLAWARRAL